VLLSIAELTKPSEDLADLRRMLARRCVSAARVGLAATATIALVLPAVGHAQSWCPPEYEADCLQAAPPQASGPGGGGTTSVGAPSAPPSGGAPGAPPTITPPYPIITPQPVPCDSGVMCPAHMMPMGG
jgi:hypothetical protein